MVAGFEKIIQDNPMFGNSFWSKNLPVSDKVDIQLPGERFCKVHGFGKEWEYNENGDRPLPIRFYYNFLGEA